ncbi:hypothetical protein like AT5G60720 [Hibiscus trionum]|uniref:DUF547 domain-containing protein n=1 Tax=Hibiscus trionum TaxID=183268 RepID=A0A9W7LYP4_HIBTR|nr:hypothetical protein like AT5G60720 [Hibiscus trionum]
MLQKMLNQEEKMHEILERVHYQEVASSISIPSFLPPKTKELLTELAMVEGEIARLETQISQLKQEKEVTKDIKSKHWQPGSLTSYLRAHHPSNTPNPSPIKQGGQDKVVFETKALHFITKAIKGDYSQNERIMDSSLFSDQKENQYQGEVKFQDRVPRKSSLFKAVSPLRDLSHPSPKIRGRISESNWDLPPKSLSSTLLSEENSQIWHPNKLSENIMKCLNFILVRLLRTSRAMELEKSGPITRFMATPLSSTSFRVETTLNTKSSLGKESRQQDPYGIFDTEESIPRDIGSYKNLVIFASSSMDPKCISTSVPLLKKLRVLLGNLQKVDPRSLTYQQKLAFWINTYNACIMHGYLQYGVPNTPEKFLTLMNKATLNVGGNTISAQAMEHYIIRKPASSNMKDQEAIVCKPYGLQLMDPNVTFALSCGTRSSPAVRIYTADGVAAELEKSKLEYLQASIVVTSTKKIAVPELLMRNMYDFSDDMNSLVQWVCQQLPTSGSLRKSMVDCFRSHTSGLEKIPYDFEFQYLLSM